MVSAAIAVVCRRPLSRRLPALDPSQYLTVASFGNDTSKDVTLHLEMLGEEVVLSSGHQIDLLAKPGPNLLPIAIHQVAQGIQVFPNREFDPDWHVRFNGKIIRAEHPLRLADHDGAACDR